MRQGAVAQRRRHRGANALHRNKTIRNEATAATPSASRRASIEDYGSRRFPRRRRR
jgi:hypothetical protein